MKNQVKKYEYIITLEITNSMLINSLTSAKILQVRKGGKAWYINNFLFNYLIFGLFP